MSDRQKFKINVNGKTLSVEVEPEMPLLWVLRETLGLTGTKFGCGKGLCGACTVHVDESAVRSCQMPIASLKGRVVTIEGLTAKGPNPLQKAWIEKEVPQCGYCQPGQIMTAAALIKTKKYLSEDEIASAMTNICRCTTYPRIRQAVLKAKGGKNA